MKEIADILQALQICQGSGRKAALATVVLVEGSSYRGPGARMLITEDGDLTGAISGGCLEGDALKKALLVIDRQKNSIVTYDTRDEDDARFGVQLGCNGIIHILFEPVRDGKSPGAIAWLRSAMGRRQYGVLATLFDLDKTASFQPGTSLFFTGEEMETTLDDAGLIHQITEEARSVWKGKASSIRQVQGRNGSLNCFFELLEPAINLVIVGAGNDARPLATMAKMLGWNITLVDGRPGYANPQRFPQADHIIVDKPAEALKQVIRDKRTAFVLMTHNYIYDMAVLEGLLTDDLCYIGMLGPWKKRERMIGDLICQGIPLGQVQQERIFSPMGLDIGAETPEEIALSVLAEIHMVISGRKGGSLREARGSVHYREGLVSPRTAIQG
ncbi:MAG TPA: XdhC family protein [Chitinophagaceae bacterium]|nr:XdhC family protein [Chitinophagaceae bacterium]